jgi:hypothetical protein
MPVPDPDAPPVMITIPGGLGAATVGNVAVQGQPEVAVMVKLPVDVPPITDALVGDRLYVHALWFTVWVQFPTLEVSSASPL